ncbi:hypothetical protein Q8A67_024047 [Cirrhinus molitorella]|uniref:Uncharacterized protein n=1 Tax=Cirrhinus molitorella TaxID=172907 RepID=A0AA88TAR4_9TELE|nr:hypothetical protein Q8A67_024047 [Cirrhinus molitorella]
MSPPLLIPTPTAHNDSNCSHGERIKKERAADAVQLKERRGWDRRGRAEGEPPLRNPHTLHPFLLAPSVVESSSALQLGHLPEASHPQWDVRCLTQALAALGLKPQLRAAAGFLVKADRLQASDSSHRNLCCRQTPQRR